MKTKVSIFFDHTAIIALCEVQVVEGNECYPDRPGLPVRLFINPKARLVARTESEFPALHDGVS
eukprot:768666-Hanusia_phi.AAC.3